MSELGPEQSTRDLVREMQAVLGRRLDGLERENRRLRRWSTMMLTAATGIFLLSVAMVVSLRQGEGSVADEFQARSFILRDDDGHARAVLGTNPDGSSRLVFQDRDGRERLRLTLLPDGSPGITFADRDGRARAVLGLLPDQTSTLVFADRAGRSRTVLGFAPDESSTLVFADRDGYTRAGLGLDTDGTAALTLLELEPEEVAEAGGGADPDR